MIVVDASAVVAALLNAGPARIALASDQLPAPHLVDSEVASALRRQVITRDLFGPAPSLCHRTSSMRPALLTPRWPAPSAAKSSIGPSQPPPPGGRSRSGAGW